MGNTVRVKVFAGEKVIGSASLTSLDPPMHIAMGTFEPSPAYDSALHANVVDGDYIGDRSELLRVETENGPLQLNAISIQDFPTLDEIQIQLLGIAGFDNMFADYPDYQAYWHKAR